MCPSGSESVASFPQRVIYYQSLGAQKTTTTIRVTTRLACRHVSRVLSAGRGMEALDVDCIGSQRPRKSVRSRC